MIQSDAEHWQGFWWFVAERQEIYHRRFDLGLPKPWTDDPVLQRNKFTNTYRELDPGTEYVLEQILPSKHSDSTIAFNVLLYRVIGRKETHATIGMVSPQAYSISGIERKLRMAAKTNAQSVFTGAYLVHPYHWMGGADKIANMARLFGEIAENWQGTWDELSSARSSREAFAALRGCKGIGDFLAFQTLVDLQYPRPGKQPVLPFGNDAWAKAGPGAKKGLSLVFPNTRNELEAMQYLRDHQRQGFKDAGVNFPWRRSDSGIVQLSLANIQNCLCEYHKYVKIRNGTGQARASYDGVGKSAHSLRAYS